MKKITFLLMLIVLLNAAVNASAQDAESVSFVSGEWEYAENPTGITLTARHAETAEAEIPEELDGKPVTQLGKELFKNNRDLVKVYIPDGITAIGANAFNGCAALKEVRLPETLTKIDSGLFRYCISLETIDIPFSVTSVGSNAFSDCISLSSVRLFFVTSVGESAFEGCQQLTEVTLSSKTASIGAHAFRATPWLDAQRDEFVLAGKGVLIRWNGTGSEVRVPYGVRMISDAFEEHYQLESVILPDTVQAIGAYAFCNAYDLKHAEIPQSVTTIGANAFSGCRSLTEIDLPDSLLTIGGSAFRYCDTLTGLSIPDNITSIPAYMLADCPALTVVSVPAGAVRIHEKAFVNSAGVKLQVVYGSAGETFALENGLPYNYAIRKNADFIYSIDPDGIEIMRYIGTRAEAEIPAAIDGTRVTSVGVGAFQNLPHVRKVTLPLTVRTIGDWAFSYMEALEEIRLPAGLRSLGSNAFSGSQKLQQIRLPEALTDLGDKPFDKFTGALICAPAESLAAQRLQEMEYTVQPYGVCSEDEEQALLLAELQAIGITIGTETYEGGPVEIIQGNIEPDHTLVRIPNGTAVVTAGMLGSSEGPLILVIPASVTSIDSSILTDERTLTIVAPSGSAAETFALENGVRFMSRVTNRLILK